MCLKEPFAGIDEYSDESLAAAARNGCPDAAAALVFRYSAVIKRRLRFWCCPGIDADDLMQEGLIGLIGAVKTYDSRREASFRTYASVCIKSKILTAITSMRSGKHIPVGLCVPIDGATHGLAENNLLRQDPLSLVISNETYLEMKRQMEFALSPFEKGTFYSYLGGYSYDEIAGKFCSSKKAVGNALERARRKLRRIWCVGR